MTHGEATPVRVLLVEDDPDDFLLTQEVLEEISGSDYDVTWVASADEAIAFLKGHEHDVCLLDFHLGPHTGLDVLAALDGQRTLPCILLTGQSDPDTDRAAMAAGAADYLVKGEIDANGLERSIRYAIGNAEAVRSLQASEERFRSVVEAATDGIAMLDSNGIIITCNQALADVFALEKQALSGRQFLSLLGHEDAAITTSLATFEGNSGGEHMEVTGRRSDGSEFPLEVSASSWFVDNNDRFWSVIVRDVTERKRLADQLMHQAFHDPLTGLANRARLRERVDRSLARIERDEITVALLFLDLDDFKRVNDSFGHEVGDELLTSVAQRLQGCVRADEIVARLGGDEFAVCMELKEATGVLRLADRIVDAMAAPFFIRERPLDVRCSIGIALTERTDSDADELLRHADVAMYAAKDGGKNRYEVFEDAMHGQIVERLHIEHDLRSAIANEQLELYYQPVVQLGTLEIAGFEALSRWNHPERGPVSPALFISVAEETGLIQALGRHALERAVRQAAEWHRDFPDRCPTMSVNLSSRQLTDSGLVHFVGDLLDETGLPPQSLTLEVTETVMVGDVAAAINVLGKLRELGIRLALDDFGTGYSSLSYLHLLPLDIVKVDQAFVSRIETTDGASLVRGIASIAHGLGMDLVAEGIEDGAQRRFLTQAGYRFGQGYLFSRPVPATEATELLRQDHPHDHPQPQQQPQPGARL